MYVLECLSFWRRLFDAINCCLTSERRIHTTLHYDNTPIRVIDDKPSAYVNEIREMRRSNDFRCDEVDFFRKNFFNVRTLLYVAVASKFYFSMDN